MTSARVAAGPSKSDLVDEGRRVDETDGIHAMALCRRQHLSDEVVLHVRIGAQMDLRLR